MASDERIAVVAHELLNRMTVVAGAVDLALRVPDLPPQTATILAAAKRQAAEMADTLRALVKGDPGPDAGPAEVVAAGADILAVDLEHP